MYVCGSIPLIAGGGQMLRDRFLRVIYSQLHVQIIKLSHYQWTHVRSSLVTGDGVSSISMWTLTILVDLSRLSSTILQRETQKSSKYPAMEAHNLERRDVEDQTIIENFRELVVSSPLSILPICHLVRFHPSSQNSVLGTLLISYYRESMMQFWPFLSAGDCNVKITLFAKTKARNRRVLLHVSMWM